MTRTGRFVVMRSLAAMTVAVSAACAAPRAPAPAPEVRAQPALVAPDSLHPYQPGIDVEQYDFHITLPERGRMVHGQAGITFSRRLSVDTIRLDLLDMTVMEVQVDGAPRQYRRDSARVHVPLRAGDGERVQLAVRWQGQPVDGLIIREDSVRGWSAFGDNWPNRGRHWLPTVDHPSDKATVLWTITAPAARQVVANGVQLERTVSSSQPGFHVTRFAMRQPIPTYLMVLGAAVMQETSLGETACGAGIDGGCVPQSVWTFPQERDYVPGPFSAAGRMIEFFARTAGSFPYERLAHLQSATRFGGMENATAIFYSDQAFRRRDVGSSLIAHEIVHHWFGNAVTPRHWADLWLSEGFASYWAPLYLRESAGDSAFRAEMRRIRETILAAPVVAQRPVVDSVGAEAPLTLLNANSYQKGGFVLHMLRSEVGDSAFFRAAREYQRRYRHGTATTAAYRQVIEQSAGRSLRTFFDQWLHRPGFADLRLRWRWNAEAEALVLDITQGTQFPPFAMPLTLSVRDAAGREVRVRADIAAAVAQSITIPVPGVGLPTGIDVDPDATVLGRIHVER